LEVILDPAIELQETVIPLVTPHVKNITNLDWSKDGRWLVTSSEDMAIVWDVGSVSNPLVSRDGESPFVEFCKIPAHSCKISFCTFLEPQKSFSETLSDEPPLVIFGEYQALHVWKITKPTGSTVSPVRVTSIPNCQNGVVSCIDNCFDESFDSPTSLVVSSSGGVKNNLKIWKFS
jgi:WD40 repeat protein